MLKAVASSAADATGVTSASTLTADHIVVGSDGARGVKTVSATIDSSETLALVGPITVTKAGTTTTTASGALNNTTTGSKTVVSTAGWPTVGTLKTNDGGTVEFMSYSVVDATTINVTARGVYGSAAATHAGVVTIAYATQITAASTSTLPMSSFWSDGTQQIDAGTVTAPSVFFGLSRQTGFQTTGSQPAITLNGTQAAVFGTSATQLNAPTQVAAGFNVTAGGSTSTRMTISSTGGFGVYVGSGAPTVVAAKGSLYLRSDGSTTNDRAYIATDSAGAWTSLVTAT